ncbi:O-antigen ligase family protein [Fredinandcohnia salidurans]|uniref:O-antigen ligase family protein n=1 Tax=Fredinandcohnia salidurans TaxID=2595041 RepID=A0ABW4MQA7_9BACI
MSKNSKIFSVIYCIPFFAISFLPSQYASFFRYPSPLGELRPDFLLLTFCLIFFILISAGQINLTALRELTSLLIISFIFFVMNVLSIYVNDLSFESFRYSLFSFLFCFGFLILASLSRWKINHIFVLKIFAFASTLVSIMGVLEFFQLFDPYKPLYLFDNPWFGSGNTIPRIVSSIGNPLVLSGYLLLIIPILFYLKELSNSENKWNLLILLHILALFLTQSRSALIVFLVMILYFSSKSFNSFFKNSFTALAGISIFLLIISNTGFGQEFVNRLLFRTSYDSITIRGDAFSLTTSILQSGYNLLFGVGPNMVNSYIQNSGMTSIQTLDNVFLMLISSVGILGFIPFVLLLIFLFIKFNRMETSLKKVGNSLLIIFVGMGFSFNVTYYTAVWGCFWAISSLLVMHNMNNKLKNKKLHV